VNSNDPSVSLGAAGAAVLHAQQTGDAARSLAALDAALSAIEAPALLMDRKGEILRANAMAGALPNPDLCGLRSLLADAVTGRFSDPRWELRPVRGTPGYLAILRAPPPQNATGDSSWAAACARWRLSVRQTQVLDLVVRGLTNADIAETLAIALRTVEFHISAIFDKVGVDNRVTLMARLRDI
jgi:DNA-binding CsgD family transcriptional regulator